MKRIIFLILFTFIFFYAFAEDTIKVVAIVNNEVITSKDLDDFSKMLSLRILDREQISQDNKTFKEKALEKLIEDKLILDCAKKEKFQIPSYLIEAKLNEIISNFSSREEFEASLIEKGLTITFLRERIKEQYLMQLALNKYVNIYISVSPSEILQFYKDHFSIFIRPVRYALWIAKTKNKNKLIELLKIIKEKGISEAKEKYESILVNLEITKDRLNQDILEVVDKMKEGEIIIKKIADIDYLIYLEKIFESEEMPLEEAKDKILILIRQHKFRQRYQEWIKELKEKALIKIYN